MTRQQQGFRAAILLLLLLCCLISQYSSFVWADPSGAAISGASTVTAANRTPDNRTDARGTITTMILNSIQQSARWKAYVGNVTGVLTLDNPSGMTIYDWQISTFTGEVYASRYGNLSWTTPSCAPQGLIINESLAFGMTSEPDRINLTFNATAHQAFNVGATTIGANTCNSTATYINDTRQSPSATTPFQEVLIRDTTGYLVYMTGISDNVQGFDNATPYDFQLIVPENITGSPTPYYFYVELG